jgi:hypothetical protein
MRKQFILIFLILASFTLFGQQKEQRILLNRVDSIESTIQKIQKQTVTIDKIENINTKIEYQQKLYDQTISSISTQLDSANYSLTIFGLLFAVTAIIIGVYVTYVERKIVRISEENKELLTKNQNIKKEVEDLNRLIQSDIYNLFIKIKKEETEHILQRLTKVPKDIANVCESLLSRDLSPDNFAILKQAYFKLKETDNEYKVQYHLLFFQHFYAQSLRDEQIRKDLVDFIPHGIQSSFENDIVKTTSDFILVINEKGPNEFIKEINNYFKGLTASEHKKYESVYETIITNLKQKEKAFELFNLIESNENNRIAKIEYGNLVRQKFTSDSNTESEKESFKELEKLILEQATFEKEQEEKRKKAEQEAEERKKKIEERKQLQAQRKENTNKPSNNNGN